MVQTLDASSPLHRGLSADLPVPTAALSVRVATGVRVLSVRHLTGGAAAVAACGLTPLPEPGTFGGTDPWLVWAGPAELLLLTTRSAVAESVLRALAPGRDPLTCVLDQSAGCLVIQLMGQGVTDVLLHLLDVNAVPQRAGEATRTRLMDAGIVILRLEVERVWLVVDRAHGDYATQWITHALSAEPGPA